ncbi:MAG: RusA family crossover junction endodeoxyribonuclease [Sphingobacteriales bacterium]
MGPPMSCLELWLPYPPSTNRLWRRARVGMIKSEEYVAWLLEAKAEALRQGFTKVVGSYKLSITAARPDKRKRDLDNLIKPVSDLLKSIGAIEDDHLCDFLSARWVTSGDGVAVRIEKAGME